MIRTLLPILLLTMVLSGCGYVNVRPYGYLEIYQLVPNKFHLRIPYLQTSRGNVHGLLFFNAKKGKDYIGDTWFIVDAITGIVTLPDFNSETNCPYGNHRYPARLVRGSFEFSEHSVKVKVHRYRGHTVTDEDNWYDHDFNGTYEVRALKSLKDSENITDHSPNFICPKSPNTPEKKKQP
jgi:hypothetical protein